MSRSTESILKDESSSWRGNDLLQPERFYPEHGKGTVKCEDRKGANGSKTAVPPGQERVFAGGDDFLPSSFSAKVIKSEGLKEQRQRSDMLMSQNTVPKANLLNLTLNGLRGCGDTVVKWVTELTGCRPTCLLLSAYMVVVTDDGSGDMRPEADMQDMGQPAVPDVGQSCTSGGDDKLSTAENQPLDWQPSDRNLGCRETRETASNADTGISSGPSTSNQLHENCGPSKGAEGVFICGLCGVRERDIHVFPCRHVMSCEPCSRDQTQCTSCGQAIKAMSKVYLTADSKQIRDM